MKNTSRFISFLQASGFTVYVVVLALYVHYSGNWIPTGPGGQLIVIPVSLLLFVISALVSGSLILAYPIHLFFESRKKEASRVIFETILWLVIFFEVFNIISLLLYM
jgi:hypothetical protein